MPKPNDDNKTYSPTVGKGSKLSHGNIAGEPSKKNVINTSVLGVCKGSDKFYSNTSAKRPFSTTAGLP